MSHAFGIESIALPNLLAGRLAGIVTGVLIIALFGLFEKRRDDVLRMVDELKQWEA